MLPQKILKIRIFNLAENEFQTTKFTDFSLTFGILSQIPLVLGKFLGFQGPLSNSLTFPSFPGFQELSFQELSFIEVDNQVAL